MLYARVMCLCGVVLSLVGCGGGGGQSGVSTAGISILSVESNWSLKVWGAANIAGRAINFGVRSDCGLPSLSPDGTAVAFASYYNINPPSDGDNPPCAPPLYDVVPTHIFLATQTGGAYRLLHSGYGYNPAFSWDGGRIVFCHEGKICVINVDATNERDLPNSRGDYPQFSPDGTKIVYTAYGAGGNDIHVVSVDGSGDTRLTSRAGSETLPVFSPDGRMIAYVTSPQGQIYVMNADGSDQRRVAVGAVARVRFSPDSRQVMYAAYAGSGVGLYSVSISGGTSVLTLPLSGTSYDLICR